MGLIKQDLRKGESCPGRPGWDQEGWTEWREPTPEQHPEITRAFLIMLKLRMYRFRAYTQRT